MRIGLITGEYPPMQGGVGAFSRELARAFAAAHHVPHVLTDVRAAFAPEPGITVTASVRQWNRAIPFALSAWARADKLDVLNLQYQAAAFNMAGLIYLLPGRVAGLPLVVTFHDLLPSYLFPKAGPIRQQAVRLLARRAAGVIVTNPQDEARVRSWGRTERLWRIPIGSNVPNAPPSGYERNAWRAGMNLPAEAVLIGYFGFMNATKGVETLLRAVAAMGTAGRPVYLSLIGGRTGTSDPTNTAYADQIDQVAAALGISDRLRRTGFVTEPEVSAHLLACDVLALPYSDGVSFRRGSFMAGLAHGCPIVTTTPAVRLEELHDGENVLLVPPEAPDALGEALTRLLNDPPLRETLSQGARRLAARFAWDHIAAETLDAFTATIEA